MTTPERSALAPNIPTMRESAPELAKFDVSSWFGIFLPKSAPAPVVDALNKEIKVMLEREDIKKTIGKMGATRRLGHAAAISDFVQAETAKFGEIIKQRRPADGRRLSVGSVLRPVSDDLLIFLTLASVASIDKASSRMAFDSSSMASFWSCDLEARSA